MKIGIMTFWWSNDNYGQLLQCYALQKYLRDLGHEAYLIRYNFQNDFIKSPVLLRCIKLLFPNRLFKYIKNRINLRKINIEQKLNDRKFDYFRNKYIIQSEVFYHNFYDLNSNPPEADAYIVGSDQVWNYSMMNQKSIHNIIHSYFLDFGSKDTKRLSFAASWGISAISDELAKQIKPLLANFDYISVREESGVEICSKCGRSDAEWVCDPTLLLNADKYRSIYNENEIRKPNKKFVMLYILNNAIDFDIQTVYAFAEKKGLDVIYVTGNGVIDNRKKTYATIPEWLWLVDNAEYAITNSFHCAVFSIIFHTQFTVIPLSGKWEKMNKRIESLFKMAGINNRFLLKNDFAILDDPYEAKTEYSAESFRNQL